jgi:hypothetical protein
MKTIIHVNQHVIKRNRVWGENEPPLTIKSYKGNVKAHEVKITGEVVVVHRPDDPLSCGARVWIETHEPVEIIR